MAHAVFALSERCGNQLLRVSDSVGAWSSRLSKSPGEELTAARVHILNRHEFLMPDDLLGAVRGGDSDDSADVFQDAEAIGHVFPEKASIFVQNDSVGNFGVFGHHREGNSAVANVSVEYTLQATLITDLAIVHSTDAL